MPVTNGYTVLHKNIYGMGSLVEESGEQDFQSMAISFFESGKGHEAQKDYTKATTL